jgi:nucleoid DNA-binding protein
MTKAEFVESLASILNQTKSESERILEAVTDVIKQALQRGEKVDLRGLGVFKVRESKPRQARNPRTGEALSIPARKAAVFKPGKELSALLNKTTEEPDDQPKPSSSPSESADHT